MSLAPPVTTATFPCSFMFKKFYVLLVIYYFSFTGPIVLASK